MTNFSPHREHKVLSSETQIDLQENSR